MNFIRCFFILFIALTPLLCLSQNDKWIVSGNVYDEGGDALQYVTAYIYSTQDSSRQHILDVSYTDSNGFFLFEVSSIENQISLVCDYLGYEKVVLNVTSDKATLLKIDLDKSAYKLSEVVVYTDAAPITTKNDTLVYKVDQFRDSTERKVVDLLRKLPGVEIDLQGQVSVDGKPIKKVLIEGTDMFGRKYTIGTENLSADYIEEIEIINNYQENGLLKNIVESEDIVINLKLKDSAKGNISGNVYLEGGYGNEGKGAFDATLFSISKKFKNILISNNGNVGTHYGVDELQATYSFSNYDPLTSAIPSADLFVDQLMPNYLMIEGPFIDNSVNTFNTIRSYFDLKGGTEFLFSGTYASKKESQNINTIEESFLDGTSYANNVIQQLNLNNSLANMEVKLNHLNHEKEQSFDLFARLETAKHNGENETTTLLDTDFNSIILRDVDMLFSFLYSKKILSTSVFQVAAKYSIMNGHDFLYTENSDFSEPLMLERDLKNYEQKIDYQKKLSLLSLKYTQKVKSVNFVAKSTFSNSDLDVDGYYSVFDVFEKEIKFDERFRLSFEENFTWKNEIFIRKSINRSLKLNIDVSNFYAINKQEQYQSKFFLDETFSYNIRLKKTHNRYTSSSYSYNYDKSIPSKQFLFRYLSSNFDIHNTILKNTPESGHAIKVNLTNKRLHELKSYYIGLAANLGQKKWIQNISFYESVRSSTPYFTEKNNEISLYGKWEKFFPDSKTVLEFLPNIKVASIEYVNEGIATNVNSISSKLRYQISIRGSKLFLMSLEGFVENNLFRQLDTTDNFFNFNIKPSLKATYRNIKIDLGFSYFNSLSKFQASPYWGSTLRLEKEFKINKSSTNISFKFNNFLNVQNYTEINRSDFFLIRNSVEAITPFFLFGIDFNI